MDEDCVDEEKLSEIENKVGKDGWPIWHIRRMRESPLSGIIIKRRISWINVEDNRGDYY